MPTPILLYGSSGVGKSYLAQRLAAELGYRYVQGDQLRWQASAAANDPNSIFACGTAKAWRRFGALNEENAIRGFLAVRHAMSPLVEDCLQNNPQQIVFEAPFLDPILFRSHGQVMLLTLLAEDRHRAQVYQVRTNSSRPESILIASRLQQTYLQQEAQQHGIVAVDNSEPVDCTMQRILELLPTKLV